MRLVLAAFCLAAIQCSAQFWTVTSGPPAASLCMTTNALGHVFVGTPYSAVYRSMDWGNTWTRLDKGIDDGGANFHLVETIKAADDGTLYAGVKGYGLLRSKNNGDTWEKLDLGIEVTSSARISVSTEKLTSGNIAVFAGYDAGRPDLFLYYSSNGGDTFAEVPKSNLPAAASSIFETFMSPNSDLMFVLVSYNKGLYRTSNMGQQWTRIDSDPNSGESDDNFLTMTADRNGVLYLGRNALPSSTHSPNAVVMRSTNDGTSWEYLVNGWDNRDITNNRVRGIAFGPGNDIWAITEKTSGVFYSSNGGEQWISQNDGFNGGGSGYAIAVGPTGHVYVAPAGGPVYRHLNPAAGVQEAPTEIIGAGNAFPNPAEEHFSINIEINTSSVIRVELTDMQGRQALQPFEEMTVAGYYTIGLETKSLGPGMYAWRVLSGKSVKTGTVIIR